MPMKSFRAGRLDLTSITNCGCKEGAALASSLFHLKLCLYDRCFDIVTMIVQHPPLQCQLRPLISHAREAFRAHPSPSPRLLRRLAHSHCLSCYLHSDPSPRGRLIRDPKYHQHTLHSMPPNATYHLNIWLALFTRNSVQTLQRTSLLLCLQFLIRSLQLWQEVL